MIKVSERAHIIYFLIQSTIWMKKKIAKWYYVALSVGDGEIFLDVGKMEGWLGGFICKSFFQSVCPLSNLEKFGSNIPTILIYLWIPHQISPLFVCRGGGLTDWMIVFAMIFFQQIWKVPTTTWARNLKLLKLFRHQYIQDPKLFCCSEVQEWELPRWGVINKSVTKVRGLPLYRAVQQWSTVHQLALH